MCKAENPKVLAPLLEYESSHWTRGPFGSKRRTSIGCMINKKTGEFLSGLLGRLMIKHEFTFVGKFTMNLGDRINLFNKQLRDYQIEMVDKALKAGRGVIEAPGGVGKTLCGIAISSTMRNTGKTVFICPSIDLLKQTANEYRKEAFSVYEIGDGNPFDLDLINKAQITVTTIQSLAKVDPGFYTGLFDICITDECHCVNNLKGTYAAVLQSIDCYHKFGLTATVPKDRHALLSMEGLIGPVVARYNEKKAVGIGAMAKAKITFLPMKRNPAIAELKSYKDIYRKGVVENSYRNKLIACEMLRRAKEGKTVLAIIREIEHGQKLLAACESVGAQATFIFGGTDGKARENIKEIFKTKDIKIVICSDIWNEGVDVPSLDCVLNARGGKSRREAVQFIYRGTRATDDKKEFEIIEPCDPYRYLAEHFVIRLGYYTEKGWCG